MVPTRELCQQVCSVANDFGRQHGISATAIFGGASKSNQIRQLRGGEYLASGGGVSRYWNCLSVTLLWW